MKKKKHQKQIHRHREQTQGYQRGKCGKDKLGVWGQQIHTTIYKIDKGLYSASWNKLQWKRI